MDLITVPPLLIPPPRTAKAADRPCQLLRYHAPIPSRTQGHHRFPVYLQMRLWREIRDHTLFWLCGTCHDSVHDGVGWLLLETRRPDPMPGRAALSEAANVVERYKTALAAA